VRSQARERDVERRRREELASRKTTVGRVRVASSAARVAQEVGRRSKVKSKASRQRGGGGGGRGGGRGGVPSKSPSAWGDKSNSATLVHFQLPSSFPRCALYVVGLLAMVGLVVATVVLVTKVLVSTDDEGTATP
jgi:hypothetical protein